MKIINYRKKPTLCWKCKNCYKGRGCEWADSFTPVKGWLAEKEILRGGTYPYETYRVEECPKFEEEKRRK